MRKSEKLEVLAKKARRDILDITYRTKSPHIGSSFSCVDILTTLYFKVLDHDPLRPSSPGRDRFIFSKGHACSALYTVLKLRGFLNKTDISGFAVNDGLLEQHPMIDIEKGIEVSSGSLGHGLSVGVGMALAARQDRKKHRVFVLLSDGELNEGSTWEAIMFASRYKLDNLVTIVDYNRMQALDVKDYAIDLEPMAKKWDSFGWSVKETDGHDLNKLSNALKKIPFSKNKPSVVIAHTTKGKGVSFMENNILWHYRAPNEKEYQMARTELEG